MHQSSSVFTLSDTDTETETDEMATVPNGISVSEQSEHLHTILYSPFFIGYGLGLCQCERSLTLS